LDLNSFHTDFILHSFNVGLQCSIDALLERTIKHMLFLQSVTKHADKLKQTGESKVWAVSTFFLLFPPSFFSPNTLFEVNGKIWFSLAWQKVVICSSTGSRV